jgi:hypothetical protein
MQKCQFLTVAWGLRAHTEGCAWCHWKARTQVTRVSCRCFPPGSCRFEAIRAETLEKHAFCEGGSLAREI